MKGKRQVPLWVAVVHTTLEFIEYKILSPMRGQLVDWRTWLMDEYCRCEKCLERESKGNRHGSSFI